MEGPDTAYLPGGPRCPPPSPASPRPVQMFADYEQASAAIEGLSKKVNKKVMQMFEKAEQEYGELKRKKDVVEGDKSRIEQVGGRGGAAGTRRQDWDWHGNAGL